MMKSIRIDTDDQTMTIEAVALVDVQEPKGTTTVTLYDGESRVYLELPSDDAHRILSRHCMGKRIRFRRTIWIDDEQKAEDPASVVVSWERELAGGHPDPAPVYVSAKPCGTQCCVFPYGHGLPHGDGKGNTWSLEFDSSPAPKVCDNGICVRGAGHEGEHRNEHGESWGDTPHEDFAESLKELPNKKPYAPPECEVRNDHDVKCHYAKGHEGEHRGERMGFYIKRGFPGPGMERALGPPPPCPTWGCSLGKGHKVPCTGEVAVRRAAAAEPIEAGQVVAVVSCQRVVHGVECEFAMGHTGRCSFEAEPCGLKLSNGSKCDRRKDHEGFCQS